MTKNTERRDKFQRIAENRARYEADPQCGIVAVHGWGVRKSAGFDVQQILTQSRPSRLEQRSDEQPKREIKPYATPYWFLN